MKFLAQIVKLGAHFGEYAAYSKAQDQAQKKARSAARRSQASGVEGCTPCAAKHKGAELVNKGPDVLKSSVWK